MVITCENEDRINQPGFNYFPAVPCYLDEWVKENKHQEFYYYEDSEFIKDAAHDWELGFAIHLHTSLAANCKSILSADK